MIKAVAIDDELPALNIVENFSVRTGFIEMQKVFNQPTEALKYLKKFPVDLVFLDINMPSLNGIELYKAIPQHAMVIFTTAYGEYAVEGFNLNAVDYLLKPFTYQRFLQAAEKARDYFVYIKQKDSGKENFIFIRADYSLVKINIPDIVYIEAYDDYLKIHLGDGLRPVITRMTLKNMADKLPANQFCRIHRSYVVPLARIDMIKNKTVFIENHQLPVGNSYEEEFLKRFNK